MSHPVIHWEIGGRDGVKMARFYEDLFGWNAQPAGGGYWLIPPELPGIGGGLLQTEDPIPPHVTIYVQVEDLEATLDHAALLGGRIVSAPVPIPGIGRVALFEDSEGNLIGLLETS
jgi:hypothetical protein